ncbi:hypothetical protein CAUP111243_00860 [Campylobacter upsaliensis]|uniref:Uncharacterized protein n=1 Tax=Campylobacter upsaliensis TaxID=28080 RepID=A0A3S4SUA1_CAMUP|nr:hypothetical protein [Campylobacter upsaliensis]MCA5589302.1 hypothetical protein [Campylobacter upsaliensis]VEG85556.1 Uncharacterised protein [Campylobacter upsaliensis]
MTLNLNNYANINNGIYASIPKFEREKSHNEFLGYKIDQEGFFTSDFNRAMNLPLSYKIHSKSIENFLTYQNSTHFSKLDLKQTIQNAYKLFSGLIDGSKEQFSPLDLNHIPQAFEFDKNSLNITKIYSFDKKEYENYSPKNNTILTTTFFSLDTKALSENLFSYLPYDINQKAYIDENGNISTSGLFMAFISNQKIDHYIAEGETNLFGKLQGLDKNIDKSEVDNLWKFLNEYSEYFDPSELFFGILRQNLSIEDFKQLAFSKKSQVLLNEQNVSSEIPSKKTPIQSESQNKETYKDDNAKNELLKKLLENKFGKSEELELLFGFVMIKTGEFGKILSKTKKSVDIKA